MAMRGDQPSGVWHFTLKGTRPHLRKDGTATVLACWEGRCRVCGAPFEVTTPQPGAPGFERTKAFGRVHCDAHKAVADGSGVKSILAGLVADGLALTTDDGRLIVEPAGSITEQHRALIRAHKGELLDLLASHVDDIDVAGVGTCQRCRHIRRPGLVVNGYCAGRADLPLAYGAGHPLRQLPGDGGVFCSSWEAPR
ncbi:hypothetical protein AZOA_47890 [Azoarcus sp. Aa7]|nr:hypothetical protein [Azoarcus sp. Aa7]